MTKITSQLRIRRLSTTNFTQHRWFPKGQQRHGPLELIVIMNHHHTPPFPPFPLIFPITGSTLGAIDGELIPVYPSGHLAPALSPRRKIPIVKLQQVRRGERGRDGGLLRIAVEEERSAENLVPMPRGLLAQILVFLHDQVHHRLNIRLEHLGRQGGDGLYMYVCMHVCIYVCMYVFPVVRMPHAQGEEAYEYKRQR